MIEVKVILISVSSWVHRASD